MPHPLLKAVPDLQVAIPLPHEMHGLKTSPEYSDHNGVWRQDHELVGHTQPEVMLVGAC
jgi:hypothetical protein